MTWTVRRDNHGYAAAIERDGWTILQLDVGTLRNEENAEWLVRILNVVDQSMSEVFDLMKEPDANA